MNQELKDKIKQKIKDEITRNQQEIVLINTNLALLREKAEHIEKMSDEWQLLIKELG